VLDNASHHVPPRRAGKRKAFDFLRSRNVLNPKDAIQEIADEYGFSVIFLPKYSPDYNKIELYWANIKNWLRLHLSNFDTFGDGLIMAFGVR